MSSSWMIRAGRGGRFAEDFASASRVAIGWNELGDLSAYSSDSSLRQAYIDHYGNAKPGRVANAVAMIRKFRDDVVTGDLVVTYNGERREYLVGKVSGPYEYLPSEEQVGDFSHTHRVEWAGTVSRDLLTQAARNSLGSVLTVFSLSDDVIKDLNYVLAKGASLAEEGSVVDANDEDVELLKDEIVGKGHELIKDKIQSLSPEELEELTAIILRAMGYQARVSPKGPDRGVDVIASPDGLGLTQPRIKAEVKHRVGSIGSNPIRSFIGALRDGDKGLFVSTGGFTREARYEAERATIPVTLLDIDTLAELVVTHYESFDMDGRALIPLVRVFWPAD